MKVEPASGSVSLATAPIANAEFLKALEDIKILLGAIGDSNAGGFLCSLAKIAEEQRPFRQAILREIRRRLIVLLNKTNRELGLPENDVM
jgi:hypothetical protein